MKMKFIGKSVYLEDEIIKNPKLGDEMRIREDNILALVKYIETCQKNEIISTLKVIKTQYIVTQTPSSCLNKVSIKFKESESVSYYKIQTIN